MESGLSVAQAQTIEILVFIVIVILVGLLLWPNN
jgi:hypothetical protein